MSNFKLTFHLNGRGLYFDPNEPIHLDSLLVSFFAILQGKARSLTRDERPDDIQIPLTQSTLCGQKIWHGSALFPEGTGFESLTFWRKKFQIDRIELTSGSPNLTNGVYREYNMPFPLLVAPRMVAYANGNCKEVKRVLKKYCTFLGKKRAQGKGGIVSIETEHIDDDWSLVKDGKAMRWLPNDTGFRDVRVKPPYWNLVDRVRCCEVSDPYTL